MSAPVLILAVRDGERVSQAIAREADRLGVASMELLAMTASELRALRAKSAAEHRRDLMRMVREMPAERAAHAAALLRAIQK